MICTHCKSEDFNEGKIKLKDGKIQTLIYCADCGQIASRQDVKPMPEPKARKTWAERKTAAIQRDVVKPTSLTWKERKARKEQAPNTTPSTPQSTDDTTEPF